MTDDQRDICDPIPLAYSNAGREPTPEPRYYDAQLRVIFFIGGLLLLPTSAFLPALFWGHAGLFCYLLRLAVLVIPFWAGVGMIIHSFRTWRRPRH